jgi:hypothetical protein
MRGCMLFMPHASSRALRVDPSPPCHPLQNGNQHGNNYSRPEGQNVGNFLGERNSSRVLAPPGGASQVGRRVHAAACVRTAMSDPPPFPPRMPSPAAQVQIAVPSTTTPCPTHTHARRSPSVNVCVPPSPSALECSTQAPRACAAGAGRTRLFARAALYNDDAASYRPPQQPRLAGARWRRSLDPRGASSFKTLVTK